MRINVYRQQCRQIAIFFTTLLGSSNFSLNIFQLLSFLTSKQINAKSVMCCNYVFIIIVLKDVQKMNRSTILRSELTTRHVMSFAMNSKFTPLLNTYVVHSKSTSQ